MAVAETPAVFIPSAMASPIVAVVPRVLP